VITDTEEWSRIAQEYLEHLLHLKPATKPARALAYGRVTEDGKIRPLTEFEERLRAKEEHEELVADAERHARLERMETGLFQAKALADKDHVFLEVTKLQLDGPLTALDLYKLDKYPAEMVPSGSRPKNGMIVDGLHGVVYYFVMNVFNEKAEVWPRFFNVYLSERNEGWKLSCNCPFNTFEKYRPLFRRIICGFRRLRMP